MENVIIYGAGGFGREVNVLIKQINAVKPRFTVLGFVDDDASLLNKKVNDLPVLGGIDYLLKISQPVVVVFGLTHRNRNLIVELLSENPNIKFTNLVHPDIYWDESNSMGNGNVLCHGMNITCNLTLGNFNIFNGRVGIGHDVTIGDYNLLGPNSFVAGEVFIGNFNIFAMNSSVIQRRRIGNGNTVNMNSVLIKNIMNDGTYYGIPALRQKF